MKRFMLASIIALAAAPTLAAPVNGAYYKGRVTCYAEYWQAEYDDYNHPVSMPERTDKMPDGATIVFDGDKGSVRLFSDFTGDREEITYQIERKYSQAKGGYWEVAGEDAAVTRDPSEPNAFVIKPNNEPRGYERPRGEFHLNSCYRSQQ